MDPVATRYIDRDGAAMAYQVIGDGPVDVVYAMDIYQHLDLCWTDPDTSMDKIVLQTARTAPALVRAAVRMGNAVERRRARTG